MPYHCAMPTAPRGHHPYHGPSVTYQEPGGLVVQSHVYLSHTVPHLGAGNWGLHHTQGTGCSAGSLPPQAKQAPR